MGNRSNKPYMEVEGKRTTRNTSKPAHTKDGTDRQTYRHIDRQTDRKIDRRTDRWTDRKKERQTDRSELERVAQTFRDKQLWLKKRQLATAQNKMDIIVV